MAGDVWAVGTAYEPYIGRWSRQVAAEVVRWLGVPPGQRWVDVGCGTGAVTATVAATASPALVLGVDPSKGFVAHAAGRLGDGRAAFAVADATALPLRDGLAGAAVSGLVLNFLPDPDRAVAEMARVTRAGGTVAAYLWDYAEGMGLIRAFWDAAVALDERARTLDEGARFPLCRPEPLAALWAGAGLDGVEVRPVDVPTRFRDFDDFWRPFLGGQGPAPAYAMWLNDVHRTALRERLRDTLPAGPGGAIDLVARAWAVRGRVG